MHPPVNCCRLCGATSYRRVVDRDGSGALTPTSLYQCSGCSVVFADPKAWRDGGMPSDEDVSPARPVPPPPPPPRAPVPAPAAPDWGKYMPGLPGNSKR